MENLLAACVTAALCGALYTMAVRRLAPRWGLVDRPDGHRKIQKRPVALGGGLAVLLAMASVMTVLVFVPNPWTACLRQDWLDIVTFSIAAWGIVALGLVDDHLSLRGRYKLLGQLLCVSVLIFGGLVIRSVALFGFRVELGLLSVPFTVFWMLGAINAINLLDGIDGLAATVGLILTLTMAALAFMTSHPAVGAITLVFASSLLGFLPFNLPPARVYLGDAGSMLIGLMIGSVSIRASLNGPGTMLLAAPLAILTIPAFDSIAAILRRRLTGRSIYISDRAHLHHRLLHSLGSNARVLLCVGAACAITSIAALSSQALKSDLLAIVSALGVVAVFIATGLFGRVEFLLLYNRLRSALLAAFHPASYRREVRQSTVRLQGSRDWELLWTSLTESAEKLGLNKIHLDLNLPAMHEGYSANWERRAGDDQGQFWRVELPLVMDHHPVGRLVVCGERNGAPASQSIEALLEIFELFESQVREMTEDPLPV